MNFFTNLSLKVMECWETVHKYCILRSIVHNCLVNLIWKKCLDSLCPYFVRLAH